MEFARMGSRNVVSIAAYIEDEELQKAVVRSDYIRNETMRRCLEIPSYRHKSLKWKNRYYDLVKRRVEDELLVAEMNAAEYESEQFDAQ